MNKIVNKLLLVLSSVLLLSTCFINSVVAEDHDDAVINIDINYIEEGEYEVIIQDDPYYEEYEPEIYVITGDEINYVYIKGTTTKVESTNSDGKVFFRINKGGTYCITNTKPSFFDNVPTPEYQHPNTGI